MDRSRLLTTLQEAGLSEKEARIYHAALSLGPATPSELARAAELKRPTTYFLVDSLKQKGLLSAEVTGFKTRYLAESPQRIEFLLDKRKQSYLKALPKLFELYNLRERSSDIRRYEGISAIKSVYDSVLQDLRPNDYYLAFCDIQRWFDVDPKFFKDFVARRATLPLQIRILTTDSLYGRQRKQQETLHNNQIRFLPKNTTLTTNLVVIPKKVIIHDLVPPISATVIESDSTVQMHREMFEVMWNSHSNEDTLISRR